ncbi:hypothetical protein [Niallia taxi]|uniref:hypothetical protein n=1 Tax=Niallia taxi TaxID=2499688 RepID=UPI0015F463AE|nr:hypothetical protein [Niallia taxi]
MGFSGDWYCPSCAEKSFFNDVTCFGAWMVCKCPNCKMRFQVYIPDLKHQLENPSTSDDYRKGRVLREW